MPDPTPINETITKLRNMTQTTTTAAPHTSTPATYQPPPAVVPQQDFFTWFTSLATNPQFVVGILVFVGVVLGVVFLIYLFARRAGRKTVNIEKYQKGVFDPSVDAVGLLLYIDRGTAAIVPLKRIEGFYVSADPRDNVLVVPNTYANPYSLDGKPLIIASASGKVGMHIDPATLTTLGFASLTVGDLLEGQVSDPVKSFEDLATALVSHVGGLSGKIKVGQNLTIGFQMHKPAVVKAFMTQSLNMLNMLLSSTTDLSHAVDEIAKSLKLYRAAELTAKGRMWSSILIALGTFAVIVIVAMLLWNMLGGFRLPTP